MWRVLLYLALFAVAAYGAVWLADHPETIAFTWAGREYSTSLAVGVVAVVALAMALSIVWSLVRWVLATPARVGSGSRRRRREKGLTALSRGIVAIGAGDVAAARRHAAEAERLVGTEPLALLLKAQTAQAAGNREAAEAAFRRMTEVPETRVLGLRGLFLEARRRGDAAEAREAAEQAARLAPAAAWANEAVLEAHSAEGDWAGAIQVVERRASLGLTDRSESRRQRAVLHAADALAREEGDPEGALRAALEAVRLAPDLVPSAALAGRLLSHKGDLKRAAKIVETAWRAIPHPDLAAAYLNLRPGDAAGDRLRRAETLARLSSWAPESRVAIARAALETRDPTRAREVLKPVADDRPAARICLLMAEIEQADGNPGRVREWLARAARAPRGEAWVGDGVVSERWAPVSPATGRLDAFRWEVPPDVIGSRSDADRHLFLDETDPAPPAPAALALPPSGPVPAAAPDLPAGLADVVPAEPAPAEPAPAGPAPVGFASAEAPAVTGPVPDLPARAALPAETSDATDRPRRASPNSPSYAPREPAPVVFPVPHAPDDPGFEPDGEKRSRLRVLG